MHGVGWLAAELDLQDRFLASSTTWVWGEAGTWGLTDGAHVEKPATARIVEEAEEDELARRLLVSKYQGWREGGRMSSWARTALPIALDLEGPAQAWTETS